MRFCEFRLKVCDAGAAGCFEFQCYGHFEPLVLMNTDLFDCGVMKSEISAKPFERTALLLFFWLYVHMLYVSYLPLGGAE